MLVQKTTNHSTSVSSVVRKYLVPIHEPLGKMKFVGTEGNVQGETMHCCISGMPGSGLSLIAQMLMASGMPIAPYQQLPEPTTPMGALPATGLAAISQQVFAATGATWDRPNAQHAAAPEIYQRLTHEATILIKSMGKTASAWVDPLAGLVLPFWQALIPELKIVVALRNPLEVAQVLHQRNQFWVDLSLQLWLDYQQALITTATQKQLLIVHFDSAIGHSAQEVRRITDFLAIPLLDSAAEQATSMADRSRRHHEQHPYSWFHSHLPDSLLGLYLNLCAYAGPAYQQALRSSIAHAIQHQQEFPSHSPQNSAKQLMARIQARRLAQQLITGGL
jgi:hypothetical protein